MAELCNAIDGIIALYNCPIFYVRGDSNCNPKTKHSYNLFLGLLKEYYLKAVEIKHPTYHHFLGDGLFDSCIDVLLSSRRTKNVVYQPKEFDVHALKSIGIQKEFYNMKLMLVPIYLR